MKKLFNLKSLLMLLTMFVGLNAWAETATMAAGTNGSTATVNGNDAIKVGTSSKGGTMTITVGAGATLLEFYAAAWNGVTGLSLNITPAENVSPSSVALTPDAGIASNSPFNLAGSEESHKYTIALSNITEETTFTLAGATAKRFVVWGATYTTGDDGGVTVAAPEFSLSAGTYVGAQTLELSSTEENASIYYTLDDSDPTESATAVEYTAPITISATTTVKAVVKDSKDNFSAVVSKTYVIEAPIANTLETAYTTAEAIALIDAGSSQLTTTQVYVKGTVSKVDSFNETYGSITYWLDDNTFQIYGGLNDEGAKFASKDDIAQEAEVVVKGIIKKYNSTYEMDLNSWLVSYTAPVAKETATISMDPTANLEVGEDNEYEVVYNGDGKLTVTSSDETVAVAIIVDNTVLVSALNPGTTTITVSASATANYYAVSKSYTLIVTGKASIPFTFDGGRSAIATTPGMSQNGLGSDYSSDPKLKFDSTGDYLIIDYNAPAKVLKYTIKGNSFDGGKFDVLQSAGEGIYTFVCSHTELESTATVKVVELNEASRSVMFRYTNKANGNVALGNISLTDGYVMDVAADELRTLCLPYTATVVGANVYNIAGTYMNGSAVDGVALEAVNGNLVAGTPYVIETTSDKVIAAYSGEAVAEAVSATGLVGNLSATALDVPQGAYIIGADNKLHKIAGATATVGQYRAYINLDGVAEYTGAAAKVMGVYDAETTGINNVEALGSEAPVYNVAGQRVAQPVKGINIINGRKVVIK